MSGKLKNSPILLSPGGITPAKMNQSHRNANWNCNSLLQNNKPIFSAIAAKMAKKKVRKTEKFLKFFSVLRGYNSCKNESITL
jgi:hypothetical protein